MIKFYDFLLGALRPLIIFFGKLHFPFSRKKITGKHYYMQRDSIEVGDVLLTKTLGEISNIINPTDLKHAGIYVGSIGDSKIKYVFESTAKGAILTDLVSFMTSKDELVISKPKFIRHKGMFNGVLKDTALFYKGYPYDYIFSPDGKAFYCFELVAKCLKNVYPELQLKNREIVKGKRIYDENTFLDKDLFEVVYDSRRKS